MYHGQTLPYFNVDGIIQPYTFISRLFGGTTERKYPFDHRFPATSS